jgi:uncharacterized membrane protein YraQ (UPF0718 family)
MVKWVRSLFVETSGALILAGVLFLFLSGETDTGKSLHESWGIPNSVLQLNTIFLSILIEAIPFVLIGVLIAGIIQIFVTEDHVRRWIPKNPILAILMSCSLGALFPACECGIVPIVRRLVAKGVPIFAGVGFLLTGPIINPIVILSTYMAFGNDWNMAASRMILGFVVAMIIAFLISLLFKGNQLKRQGQLIVNSSPSASALTFGQKLDHTLRHSIDEFFDMGKYLIVGAFFAAFVQTYVSSGWLLQLGQGVLASTIVMMGMAFLLSLCSEADAFIAASFRNMFSRTSLLGFLVYGPMLDLKNSFMLFAAFRTRFVIVLMVLITLVVLMSVLLTPAWLVGR